MKLLKKGIILNFLLQFSALKSDFTLNPALDNPALSLSHLKCKVDTKKDSYLNL